MISPNTSIIISSNALVQKVGDEMVILDAESGQYYALNEMATEMLEHLKAGLSIQATATQICDEYDVTTTEALEDITIMVTNLLEKNLASTS